MRKRGRLEALPWLALPLKSEGEYDVSIATIKKNEKAESNNDNNKIRRGHTDLQIVPKISGNHVIAAASSGSDLWKKCSSFVHHKLPPNL